MGRTKTDVKQRGRDQGNSGMFDDVKEKQIKCPKYRVNNIEIMNIVQTKWIIIIVLFWISQISYLSYITRV